MKEGSLENGSYSILFMHIHVGQLFKHIEFTTEWIVEMRDKHPRSE